jgi:hypothetical protein
MRDPDLILRAQRAAAVLEQAWDRWRTLHGTGATPPPPVSSYVGYSLEEPMGQPRVVFGVAAEEAELLASLLDRHERAGHAAAHQEAAAAGSLVSRMQRPAAGARQVPAQGTADPPERLRPAGPSGHGTLGNWADGVNGQGTGGRVNGTSGHGAGSQANLAGPPERPARPVQAIPPLRPPRPAPLAQATVAVQAEDGQPGWAAISGYAPPSVHAGAPAAGRAAPGMASGDGQASLAGEPADRQVAERARGHRHAGEHALPHTARQRRASAAAERDAAPSARPAVLPQGASRRRDSRDYRGLSTMAGDLAGWASGELPGQARRQPGAADRGRAPGPVE